MTEVTKTNLAIIIINYRTSELVQDCLTSLQSEISGQNIRVIIVDNHSNDGSPERIEAWLEAYIERNLVDLIRSPVNTGFSGGNNIGITGQEAKYYLLLNSDTLVRPGAIQTLLETAESHPEAAIVCPRLEYEDGTPQISCFRFPSPITELIAASSTGPITKLLKRFVVPIEVSDTLAQSEWVSFACVLLRSSAIHQVGLMDDGFFMYFEDIDYAQALREADWNIVYEPKARVVHLRGGSSPVKESARRGKRLPRYYYASRTRYFFKNYGWFGLTVANVFWTMGWVIALTRAIFGKSASHISEAQYRDIWTNWLTPLGDRYAPED